MKGRFVEQLVEIGYDLVEKSYAFHSLVNVLRIEFREVWNAREHYADFVARLGVQFLKRINSYYYFVVKYGNVISINLARILLPAVAPG